MTRTRAVLFDVDGTLVDSNYLHVDAWARALSESGLPTESWRIHRAIGLDSDLFIPHLHGEEVPEAMAERAKHWHTEYYKQMWPRLRPLPGARDLLSVLAERGIRVVLATSAPEDELEALRDCLGSDEYLHAYTSADDVGTAKPAPDVIEVALERAGVSASDAVMVGDAVWDARAAAKAGVITVGVRSGGISDEELLDAGARVVYRDVRDLLEHLDESPIGELLGS